MLTANLSYETESGFRADPWIHAHVRSLGKRVRAKCGDLTRREGGPGAVGSERVRTSRLDKGPGSPVA